MGEEPYRALFAAMTEGLAICELIRDGAGEVVDWRYLDVNPAREQQTGLKRDAVVGRTFREAFPDDDAEPWLGNNRTAVEEGRPVGFEQQWAGRRIAGTVTPLGGDRFALVYRDVGEQRAVEEALRDSEARSHALFAGSPVPFAVLDTDPPRYTILAANDAYYRATLTRPGTLVGRSLFEAFTDDPGRPDQSGRAALRASLGRVLRSGATDAMERSRYDLATPEGFEAHWWLAINAPLRDQDGRIVAIIHQASRQTELHLAEEALRASEEQQRLIVQLVPAMLWQTDATGAELTGNDRWMVFTGQTQAETQHFGWLDAIHPDDRDAAREEFERSYAAGTPIERRQRVRGRDGSYRWHLVRNVPSRDDAGRVGRWFGAAIDVHESHLAEQALDASERRLQTLMEGVPQLVWRGVDDGRWTWASPQWTDYTGQPESESHGRGWLIPVHPDDRDRVVEVWEGAVERGEFHAEYRIRHAEEDRYRWFQTRATPLRDSAGRIVEWLGTSTDIDDLRTLQERQQVLVRELQHRTFNLLGMVRSMADATLRSCHGLSEFGPKFRDRIDALARVQRLLSRVGEGDRVMFDELIHNEFEAVGALPADDRRVTLNGPAGVALRSRTVQIVAMAVHELTTNAVKHGALSQPGAYLTVEWRIERGEGDRPWLHIDWRESGVEMRTSDPAAEGAGQGRTLIEGALPYQLQARTTYLIAVDGVRCSIAFPASGRNDEDEVGGPT